MFLLVALIKATSWNVLFCKLQMLVKFLHVNTQASKLHIIYANPVRKRAASTVSHPAMSMFSIVSGRLQDCKL